MTTSVAPRPLNVSLLQTKAEVAQKLMTKATRVDSSGGMAVTKAERAPIEKAMQDLFETVKSESAATGQKESQVSWDVREVASAKAQHSALRDYKGLFGEFFSTLRGLGSELSSR